MFQILRTLNIHIYDKNLLTAAKNKSISYFYSMKKKYMVLLCLGMMACVSADISLVENLNDNQITVIGHGGLGMGAYHPMNTLEAVQEGLSRGLDGVELDVQLTLDTVLIAFHSSDLNVQTQCSGRVIDLYREKIKDCNYRKTVFNQNEYLIPTLREIFNGIDQLHARTIFLDCNIYVGQLDLASHRKLLTEALHEIIDEFDLVNQVCIEASDIPFLRELKILNPDLRLFISPGKFELGYQLATENDLYGIIINHDYITKEDIKLAHESGLRIALFSTNTHGEVREAIDSWPDYLQTDRINYTLKILK